MIKQFIFSLLMLFISNGIFSQSSGTFTEDEKVRIKLAVHFITYDTVGTFDNAAGEAYYTLVITSFKENLSIPQFTLSSMTPNDKTKTDRFIQLLNQIKQNPPTWDDLLTRQTQYLLWLDKISHRKSKYKTE
ncbi:MAG: hypothetical protein WC868_08505 [Bacteroidales bacterium]